MNFEKILRNFYMSISSINYNELFYNGKTGKSIPFKKVFPPGKYSIIGNSPISLEKRKGLLIDESDYVVRFNNFKLLNFENYIGSKTNIWITGGGIQAPNSIPVVHNESSMNKVLVMNNYKSFKEKQLKIIEKYTSEHLPSFIIFHNKAFLNLAIEVLQGTPTTGFLILLLLSSRYKTINTYGFSFGSYKNKYHYYNDNVKQDNGHFWKKELEMFKILLRKKMLFNNDISGNIMQINNKSFYSKNLPKHIKRLYTQRNIRSPDHHFGNPYKIPVNMIKNRPRQLQNNTKSTITDDTNNKLLELNNILCK